jgi:hypothetical protein
LNIELYKPKAQSFGFFSLFSNMSFDNSVFYEKGKILSLGIIN